MDRLSLPYPSIEVTYINFSLFFKQSLFLNTLPKNKFNLRKKIEFLLLKSIIFVYGEYFLQNENGRKITAVHSNVCHVTEFYIYL